MKSVTRVALLTAVFLSSIAPSSAEDFEFGPYTADLSRRIKKHWFPPQGTETRRVVLKFKVLNDGSVKDLSIAKSSTLAIADNAALRAVEDARPLKPLPVGAPEFIDIEFTFDGTDMRRNFASVRTPDGTALSKMPPPDPIGVLTARAEAALKANPTPDNHYAVADLYRKAGQIDAAKKEYEAALSVDPNYEPAKKILASMEAWKEKP